MAQHAPDLKVDDRELIDALRTHGSESAARALVERHTPQALSVVQRILASDLAQAEDVMQDAWIKVVKHLGTFRGDGAFGAWVTRIAARCAYDHLRWRIGQREIEADDVLQDLPSAEVDADKQLDLEQSVGRLPAGCRAVLILHDIEGFTHEEISADLGIAVGTSKAHLFRARNLLRTQLQPAYRRHSQ